VSSKADTGFVPVDRGVSSAKPDQSLKKAISGCRTDIGCFVETARPKRMWSNCLALKPHLMIADPPTIQANGLLLP
jgi:hypothetical protein